MEALARHLYDACPTVKQTWEQCGGVTRSVWIDRAKLKSAGCKNWWSINPNRETNMQTEKIIAALDTIAGAVSELSAMFSSGTVKAANPEIDAAPAKPSKAAKPAPKAAKAAKPEAVEITIDEAREKMKELIATCGSDALIEVLATAGAGKLSDVDVSEYGALLSAAQVMIDESSQDAQTKPAKKAVVKGPTLEDVKAMAGKLIEADKSAYLKVMAQIGRPSDMEPSGYASAIEEYEAAMPSDNVDLM